MLSQVVDLWPRFGRPVELQTPTCCSLSEVVDQWPRSSRSVDAKTHLRSSLSEAVDQLNCPDHPVGASAPAGQAWFAGGAAPYCCASK